MLGGNTVSRSQSIALKPIRRSDAQRVGLFLNQHLNAHISAEAWADAITPKWQVDAPNHGYMLTAAGVIVGVQLAFYSERQTEEGPVRICNLAAFCVREDHRMQSVRLLKALLSQKGYSFTDLSPSGNVRPLNIRLGFQQLDTATALVPNVAWPLWPTRTRLIADLATIATTLTGADLQIYHDHLGAQAAHHLVLVRGQRHCHVIFRRDRRKNLPLFATILHVSDPELFHEAGGLVFRHLLLRQGV
ncbi:MAG: hypothetical protein JWQ89_1899, partial [Devosia sp.]|uniref:hypothetical protein n=1 Tax=Devosia sp. TaxID=1871048 RepID=UPI002626A5A4